MHDRMGKACPRECGDRSGASYNRGGVVVGDFAHPTKKVLKHSKMAEGRLLEH